MKSLRTTVKMYFSYDLELNIVQDCLKKFRNHSNFDLVIYKEKLNYSCCSRYLLWYQYIYVSIWHTIIEQVKNFYCISPHLEFYRWSSLIMLYPENCKFTFSIRISYLKYVSQRHTTYNLWNERYAVRCEIFWTFWAMKQV